MGHRHPDIRGIIHLGRPRTLLDYGQESGRAGEMESRAEATMIISTPEPPVPWHPDQAPSMVDQALMRRVDGSKLDGYLDGSLMDMCGAV